mgnify:CR=1 FL=1
MQNTIIYSLISIGVVLFILITLRLKKIFSGVQSILSDTLKDREGKWSMPRIMMFVAFHAVLIVYFYDTYKQGKLNEFVTIALLGVAVTGKIADAKAKQIDPTVITPKD